MTDDYHTLDRLLILPVQLLMQLIGLQLMIASTYSVVYLLRTLQAASTACVPLSLQPCLELCAPATCDQT